MRDFQKIPETWEELESLKEYLADCDVLFLRRLDDQKVYKAHTSSLSRDEVLGKITDQMRGKSVAIVKNRFPHSNLLRNFPKAEHYCIWSKDGELSDEKIKIEVENAYPNHKRWMSMTRKDGHFSIPEIWHCHIYIEK